MATSSKNSLDLLRLVAAALVLYSHQHVLLGMIEPVFFGWSTFGGAGVSIFFFLSGMLVWSSWARDSDVKRFFLRRSLRIFPGLWLVVCGAVFLLGPALSSLTLMDYFKSPDTWWYLSTSFLWLQYQLPGVFVENFYSYVINGSLWTLPAEFLCYVSVAVAGSIAWFRKEVVLGVGLCLTAIAAAWGPEIAGPRFIAHFEMSSFFWWGVWYGYVSTDDGSGRKGAWLVTTLALVVFFVLGSRGQERTALMLFAASLVLMAQRVSWGAWLTDRLGDLSYGMYIFAFPVQQALVELGRGRGWPFGWYLGMSFFVTAVLAYLSWHIVEKRALRFKPKVKVIP